MSLVCVCGGVRLHNRRKENHLERGCIALLRLLSGLGLFANDQMTKSGTDANSVVEFVFCCLLLLLLLLSSSLSLFLFFNSTQTKNQYPTMEPVTEMLIWVLVPAFFIASATFLVYVYACEEPELKEE